MKITGRQLAEALQIDESTVRQWKARKKLTFDSNKRIDLKDADNYEFIMDRCLKQDVDPSVINSIKEEPIKEKITKRTRNTTKKTIIKKKPIPAKKTTTEKRPIPEKKAESKKQQKATSSLSGDHEFIDEDVEESLSQKKIRTEIAKNKLEIEKKALELDKVKGNLIDVASSNDILNRAITGLFSTVRDSVKQAIQSRLADVDSERLMDLFKLIEKEMNTALTDTIDEMVNDSEAIVNELSQKVGRGQSKAAVK